VATDAVGDTTKDQIADHGAGAGAVRTNSDDAGSHDPQMRRECVPLDLSSEMKAKMKPKPKGEVLHLHLVVL
jgi:hypothetical protein